MDNCLTAKKAIEAVEKQIPKKPVYRVWREVLAECPSCGRGVSTPFFEPMYCPFCGQVLDWKNNAELVTEAWRADSNG